MLTHARIPGRVVLLRRQRFVGRVANFRSAFGYNNIFLAAGQIIPIGIPELQRVKSPERTASAPR